MVRSVAQWKAPRFCVESVVQYHDFSSAVPAYRHGDAVAVQCIRLVYE